MSADDIFKDNSLGPAAVVANCTEIISYTYYTNREVNSHGSNDLLSSAATEYSPLFVLMQVSHYCPFLEDKMNEGKYIKDIKINQLARINSTLNDIDTLTSLESRTFSGCYIISYEQVLDYVVIGIRYTAREETFFAFSQDGGVKGQAVTHTDSLTMLTTAKG
jgi:hypothetical protein